MSTARTPADVLVCVHNSPEDVRRCLASVVATLAPGDRLIIVDDGSETETKRICEDAAAAAPDRVRLIRRDTGSGFCRAANAGLRETTAEMVVVLNSDTVVLGDWLDRIDACMTANWQVGIVGPLSNAGGWQSIPGFVTGKGPANNPIRDDDATLAAIARYCSGFSDRFGYPVVDQINGFCMAVHRKVFDTIGLFDEERFPMGYGEENDFTFRALDNGFLCSVAVDCFVYHAKTKSYTTERRAQLIAAGKAELHGTYGEARVRNAVKSTQASTILQAIREDAADAFLRNGWLLEVPDDPAA